MAIDDGENLNYSEQMDEDINILENKLNQLFDFVKKIKEFETEYLAYMVAKHQDTLDALKTGKLTDAITSVLEAVASELTAKYKN